MLKKIINCFNRNRKVHVPDLSKNTKKPMSIKYPNGCTVFGFKQISQNEAIALLEMSNGDVIWRYRKTKTKTETQWIEDVFATQDYPTEMFDCFEQFREFIKMKKL